LFLLAFEILNNNSWKFNFIIIKIFNKKGENMNGENMNGENNSGLVENYKELVEESDPNGRKYPELKPENRLRDLAQDEQKAKNDLLIQENKDKIEVDLMRQRLELDREQHKNQPESQ